MPEEFTPQDPRPPHGRRAGFRLSGPGGFFGKLLAAVLGLLLLVPVFALSLAFLAVALAVVLLGGLVFWGYLKYRVAALRRAEQRRRDAHPGDPPEDPFGRPGAPRQGGLIIEGEARRADAPAKGPAGAPAEPVADEPRLPR
jgi:hypothetical protein